MAKHLFTSESVSKGILTKSQTVSDAVFGAILQQDPKARVACETYVKTGMVWLAVDHHQRTGRYRDYP